MPDLYTDGMHQPFQNSFIVGAEVDGSKYVFDIQEETLMKRDEELVDIHHTRLSLPIPSTDQRLPFKAHAFERYNDIDLNFGQILPNINLHNINSDDVVDELATNSANPGLSDLNDLELGAVGGSSANRFPLDPNHYVPPRRFAGSGSRDCSKLQDMCFKEKIDIFDGITVQSADLEPPQKEKDAFATIILESLDQWRNRNVQGVWMKVDIKDSHIIPVLVENGFVFHHTQPNFVMMTKWLPDTPSTLPRYAHTMIGVGGLVIDHEGRVLLMKERRGYYLGWKFPGGASDPNETIFDTAAREVLEETGVQATGKALLCFRQINVSQYENVGDLYFICLMDAVDPEIKPSPNETADCRWFTRDELEALPMAEFLEFHREILRRYDMWKKTGRRGCHIASCMSLITTLLDGTLCNRFECQIAQEWAVSRAKEHQDTLLVRIK
ncbi:hypothetical protein RB195_005701 [Necator americanus]|uniref:Nudix hydrolase domain-containing protein n=1 Tax=Necator americanus TaxID=51031 RepID=A0ABR1BQZ8_NECAM